MTKPQKTQNKTNNNNQTSDHNNVGLTFYCFYCKMTEIFFLHWEIYVELNGREKNPKKQN